MRRPSIHITEKTRTVILVLLFIVAIGFIIWTKHQYTANFIDDF